MPERLYLQVNKIKIAILEVVFLKKLSIVLLLVLV